MATSPRLRVAYLVPPSPHFAGVELVVHEIATGLMQAHGAELDVHVLFATRYDDERVQNPQYTVHWLDVDRLRNLAVTLRAKVAEHRFDIIISAQVEPSVMAWVATRGLGVPIFITHLHGNPQVEERQGSRRTRIAFELFRHLISPRMAGVVAVSPTLRAYAAAQLCRKTPVYFAKNPARVLGAVETRTGPTDQIRFVNVARLSYQKGLDILLRALAIARPDLPESRLILVGSGPDEAALKVLCASLELDDIVEFVGYTSDPGAYLRTADCFVLSSRWEGFPLVLLEALRFGLPILSADCNFGPADLVTDPRIGSLVRPNDPAAMAEGLVAAAHRRPDPEAEVVRRTVANAYGRAEAAATHFGVLQRIIQTGAERSPRVAALVRRCPEVINTSTNNRLRAR